MARTVPGSGAVIKPIFDEIFGVRAVEVTDGGSGYDPTDPPRLTITGCGTPEVEALLYPIIDEDSGKIVHVRVLERGRGYNPLRLQVIPQQETPNVIKSFDINRIWQNHPNSLTRGSFQGITDRLRIESDNHPKPTPIQEEREPGGGPLVDRNFDQVFVYRGGKDVPNPDTRLEQNNKSLGILTNGGLLHTPEWGTVGNVPVGFSIDTVKYDHIKNNNAYDAVVDNNVYYYQSSKVIDEFSQSNGVFEWGKIRQFTWKIIVEFDNILLFVTNVDQTLGPIEVGRTVDLVGGTASGEIAKISRNAQNQITRIYLRNVTGTFSENDLLLGSNGFTLNVSQDPITFPNGIFYIDFGADAAEFGDFVPGQYYFSPENVKVQRNYLIRWDSSHPSNQPSALHPHGHPMQFSTTQDGLLNGGSLYYNSTGVSDAPSTDYENEFAPLFVMNSDESNRIYYYCKYHRYMSGYVGDEGYMVLDSTLPDEPIINNYYIENYYQPDSNDPNTIDYSRHVNGHSKILGLSFDGYPIYGPYGYTAAGNVAAMASSYRLKTNDELAGARPIVVTPQTITYTVTVSNDQFQFDGTSPELLNLRRGNTYIFNQDDISNDSNQLLIAPNEDGWHVGSPPEIGNTEYLFDGIGITYYIDGAETTYQNYVSLFNGASQREIRFQIPVDCPRVLYLISYSTSGYGLRIVQDGYVLGDLTQDYIYDSTVGDLDEFNGKFGVTPEYPNGTYAYFMTEDGSGNPVYPYAIGKKYYGSPLFEGDLIPDPVDIFPTEVSGSVVLTETGQVSYVKMTKKGDNYFGPARSVILGGEGTGATSTPVVQTVTGLTLLNEGRSYATPPTLIFEGGGGQGAQGAAEIDTLGKVTRIDIVDPGEFYQVPPYLLINGGGGLGARARVSIDQGEITSIDVTDAGKGYVNPPTVIFSRLVNLKRKTRTRQSYNSATFYLTGLIYDVSPSDLEIYVNSTDAFPGSGQFTLNNEIISYTSKAPGIFSGLTRGNNFNYDQRIKLDAGQNNQQGISTYSFNVGDRVIRQVENSNNKVAKVYDWNPSTRELLVVFEVDELAFIDGGIPSTADAIVQFDAGVSNSSISGELPHIVIDEVGSVITTLTVPISTLQDKTFEDDDEQDGAGDGIADLINTGTDFENQISLDGGIYNSLYGIEETQGGQNTTLFQVGDNIKDASIPFKFATVAAAGGLNEGVEHVALIDLYLDANSGNGQNYSVGEVVSGDISGVRGTVVSWNPVDLILTLQNIVPYNTGNINVGIGGYLYKFSERGTIVDFVIDNQGTNYSQIPTISIENTGDIQATGTVNMTPAGDQVDSITITNGGYGIPQTVDGTYQLHPIITFTNDPLDVTGANAAAHAILGGETITAASGAKHRIKRIDYESFVRS